MNLWYWMILFSVLLIIAIYVTASVLNDRKIDLARKMLFDLIPMNGPIDGVELRKRFKERGVSFSGPGFYSFMSTMKDEGRVLVMEVEPVDHYLEGNGIPKLVYRLRNFGHNNHVGLV